MKLLPHLLSLALLPLFMSAITSSAADKPAPLFHDDFDGGLDDGWSWIREDPDAWRTTGKGLEVLIQPGNLWGSANDSRNVLVRDVPEGAGDHLEALVSVTHRPGSQYEQAGIAWYYDDAHMVKLTVEQVDEEVWIVMGRQEANRGTLQGKHPSPTETIHLRLQVSGDRILGQFRPKDAEEWIDAGECDLPTPPDGTPKISLHTYMGPPEGQNWALFRNFRITRPMAP